MPARHGLFNFRPRHLTSSQTAATDTSNTPKPSQGLTMRGATPTNSGGSRLRPLSIGWIKFSRLTNK